MSNDLNSALSTTRSQFIPMSQQSSHRIFITFLPGDPIQLLNLGRVECTAIVRSLHK